MKNVFKKRLAQGDLQVGTLVTLSSMEVTEILCLAGFDWLFVDLEHSALGVQEAQAMLQVAGPQVPCVVRVPAIDEVWIKKVLDAGAAGIIVPQIRTAEDAGRAVQLCRYPPAGSRGAGIARAHAYGAEFSDYVARANEEVAVVIQIEHIDAVENLDSIIALPGIDALFTGPYDLSGSMGRLGQVKDPEVQAAISRVKKKAGQAGIPLGIFGTTAEAVKPYIADGYKLIAVATDAVMLTTMARQTLAALRE